MTPGLVQIGQGRSGAGGVGGLSGIEAIARKGGVGHHA